MTSLIVFRVTYQRPQIAAGYTRLYAIDADDLEIEEVWQHILSLAMVHCEERGNVLSADGGDSVRLCWDSVSGM